MINQKRISDLGIKIGDMQRGRYNKISDVKGVKVGHCTIDNERNKTGITFINPCIKNIFTNKLIASSYVINGFGKTTGLIQIDELGQLESPIVFTNTLSVGTVSNFLVKYYIDKCKSESIELLSFNPVIAECNDSSINDIRNIPFSYDDFLKAIEDQRKDFQEGDVGTGKGMICHGLKGGIGSSSRIFKINKQTYTLGVLVLTNHGLLKDLLIKGKRIGEIINNRITDQNHKEEEDKGSIIVVFATDLPASSRQLKRISKRAVVGINRLGSFIGNGSGEIVIGFSTGNKLYKESNIHDIKMINESIMDIPFRAIAESTEEAILNSMITSSDTIGYNKKKVYSLQNFLDYFFDN